MCRTRCVHFYWRKFCRLIRYTRSLQVCRQLKQSLHAKVNTIQGQYKVFTFRRYVNARVRCKKAVVIQRALREAIKQTKLRYYSQNMEKILKIQSFARMLKAKQTRRRLQRIRVQQERTVKRFEKNFMSLFNQKPSQKRKHKINKLLLDQQNVLLRERIYVGPSTLADLGPASSATHMPGVGSTSFMCAQLGVAGGMPMRGLGPGALDSLRRPHQTVATRHYQVPHVVQNLASERREKTLRALRYIQKYQHLYQSAKGAPKLPEMQRSESKLLRLAGRHWEERVRPDSPDRANGSQSKPLRTPGKAIKPSRSKACAVNSQQQSSAVIPEYRKCNHEGNQNKPKMGQKFIQVGPSSGFGNAEPDTSHLLPRSHALAQMQHHNEILAQIAGSRVSHFASAIQASRKATNSKQGKEVDGLQDRLGKIVDQKLYTKTAQKTGGGREKGNREKTSARRSGVAHVQGTNSATKLLAASGPNRPLPRRGERDGSEPYSQVLGPAGEGRACQYGMEDPDRLASGRQAYSTFSAATSGQKLPSERLLDQGREIARKGGRPAHELVRQLESAQTHHAQSAQAAGAALQSRGAQLATHERLQAVSMSGCRGRDMARVASTSIESQKWGCNPSAAAYGIKPFARAQQDIGPETEPFPAFAVRSSNQKNQKNGNEVSVATQQADQAILYVGSRGSHQPGSLGGFAGVTALDIGNESVFSNSKQTRQKSKPKQRLKRDKSGPRGGEAATSRAGIVEASEYGPGAYPQPRQAESNALSRKNSRRGKGGVEATQQTTKLPLLHQSPQTTRKEDIAHIFGLSNFYDSQKQPIRTYKQQLFVNQSKARTRIILPADREQATAEREKETTASTNPAGSQAARTISKLQKPSHDVINGQKNIVNEVGLVSESVYAMSAEAPVINNVNNTQQAAQKSESGLARKQPLAQESVQQAIRQNQSHYESIKRLENDIKLKKEILLNLSQSDNHQKAKAEMLKRGKPTSQPNPNRDCLRTIANSRDAAENFEEESGAHHGSLFLPVKGAEACRNRERSQLAYQTAHNFGSKQFPPTGLELQRQGNSRGNIISGAHPRQIQPLTKPTRAVEACNDYHSTDNDNFFSTSITLSGAAPQRSCFDQKSGPNNTKAPLGLPNSHLLKGAYRAELQPRVLQKIQPASHLTSKQQSLPHPNQRRSENGNPLRTSVDEKHKLPTKKNRRKVSNTQEQDLPIATTSYKNPKPVTDASEVFSHDTRNTILFESNPLHKQSKETTSPKGDFQPPTSK